MPPGLVRFVRAGSDMFLSRRDSSRLTHVLKLILYRTVFDRSHYMISPEEGTMLKGFRQFIMRGNVMDLAVAVVIGAAFGAVVTAFVTNILTPLIAAIVGKPDFSAFYFSANGAVISYGVFLNALVSFLLVAAAVYFFMVAPMNAWKARAARNAVPADPTSKKCPECLSEIPIAARRCAFCTSVVSTTSAPGNA